MGYIAGANPDTQVNTSAAYRSQSYTSTAGQTTFTVDGGYTPGYIDVYVNGIKQVNGVDVTATNGSTTVFALALSAGYTVEVQALRNIALNATSLPVSSITFADGTSLNSAWGSVGYLQYTGNGTTTAYSTSPYTASSVNYTSVYISGVYQRKNTYTWSGTTLTFTSAPPNGSYIEIVINYQTTQVGLPSAGTITPTMLSTGGPSWTSGGNVSITGALSAGGALAAGNTTVTGTMNVSGNFYAPGSIIQMQSYTLTSAFTTTTHGGAGTGPSSAGTDTPLTVNITPKFSTSKIMAFVNGTVGHNNGNQVWLGSIKRSGSGVSTAYSTGPAALNYSGWAASIYIAAQAILPFFIQWLDSPATTNTLTYNLKISGNNNNANAVGIGLGEILGLAAYGAPCTITVMEIAQ